MKELTIEEIKEISKNIVDSIHNFCIKNHLRYSLFSGSLLGAIRHNGFIPWDDDMDIAMPREDYNFFIANFKDSIFKVITPFSNDKYHLPWAKVYDSTTLKIENGRGLDKLNIGVDVDLYPIDYAETIEDFEYIKRKRKKLELFRNLSLIDTSNISLSKKIICTLFNNKANKYSRKLDKLSQHFNNRKNNYYMRNCPLSPAYEIYDIKIFDELITIKFDDRNYFISKYYDQILKTRYGDYMKPPKKESRKPHHGFKAYKY